MRTPLWQSGRPAPNPWGLPVPSGGGPEVSDSFARLGPGL